MQTDTFAHDGTTTRTYHWPVENPRCVVQLVHGMAEYSERYDWVARQLNEQGIAVVAHDHRGHGPALAENGGLLGYFDDRDGWEKVVADVDAVRRRFAESYEGTPWFILGHSMGSFVVRDYLTRGYEPLAGAIIVGTGRWPAGADAGLYLARAIASKKPKAPGNLLNKLVFAGYNRGFGSRTKFEWLATDPAVVDTYMADPYCGFVPTNQFFADFLGAIKRVDSEAGFIAAPKTTPLLILSGEVDPVGGAKAVEALSQAYVDAGAESVTSKIYHGKRHEILNETNRQDVVSDVVDWIAELLPTDGTGA